MKKPPKGLVKQASRTLKKASPTILTCLGAVGVVVTAVLAVKATPKALERLAEAKEAKNDENGEKLTRMETIAACWPCYIPAAATGIATIGCIFGANVLNRRQQASLASAYALLNRSYTDYKRKLKELYGEEAHQRIMKELAAEKAKDISISAGTMFGNQTLGLEELDDEERLFYDSIGDRYFTSTMTRVLEAEYHLNRNFCLGWIPSLNDFYEFLGLEKTDYGETVGWTNSNGDYYWIDFHHIHTEVDGTMDCWVIDVDQTPTPEFLDDR